MLKKKVALLGMALTMVAGAISISATEIEADVVTDRNKPILERMGDGRGPGIGAERLALTDEERAEMLANREALTDEDKEALMENRFAHKEGRGRERKMLTEEERAAKRTEHIQEIMAEKGLTQEQVEALMAEQKQKIQAVYAEKGLTCEEMEELRDKRKEGKEAYEAYLTEKGLTVEDMKAIRESIKAIKDEYGLNLGHGQKGNRPANN